jgi:hypothetical protein
MKAPRFGFVSFLAFSALLLSLLTIKSAFGQGTTQMVRLSYVEGDVRLSRGVGNLPDLSAPWQQAEADVPIEEGFSLATGSGRAEIEFDNGSTVYLAPNSLLIFKNLSAADQSIPSKNVFQIGSIVLPAFSSASLADDVLAAQIELATGTATIDLHPVLHLSFSIETPGGAVHVVFPQTAFMRVDSYLDAMALTPQEDMNLNEPNSQRKAATKGQTAYFSANSSAPIAAPIGEPADTASSAEWDKWVSARVEQRNADTAAALKASGFSAPFPGLTDLYLNGTFFTCAPYGTCWQPAQESSASTPSSTLPSASVPAQPSSAQSGSAASQSASAQSATATPQSTSTKSKAATAKPLPTEEYIPLNSCFVKGLLIQTVIDTKTGNQTVLTTPVPSKLLRWPLCYQGNWIRRNKRFVLVVKHHHHRRPPVAWVRVGKQVGYVPRHPNDVNGKPPVNIKYGIFVPPTKPDGTVKRVPYNPSEKMEILAAPPKQFRGEFLPVLEETERPEIEAHFLVRAPAYSGTGKKISSSPILYDFKSQKFVEKEIEADSHVSKAEVAILNSRGEFSSTKTGRYAGYNFASSVSSAAGSGRTFTSRSSASGRNSSGGGSGSNASRSGSGGSNSNRGSGGSSASRGGGGGGGSSSGGHNGGGGGGSMGGGGSSGGAGGGGSSGGGGSGRPH